MAKPTKLPEWDETEVNSVEPNATHKAEGWLAPAGVPEKPPYQSFNWWQNSVWKWLNEINIKGMLGYDALTDYIADLSYTVGSDGNLYQCGINNGPASSIVDPVGDVTGTWNDIINVTPPTARGYIDGLILENDTDTDHDIKMNIGICRDKTDIISIPLIAAIVKQIDVNWAEGDNDGGFPSGLTLLADTWYHFYIIMSADKTQIDAGFDTSLTAINLLSDATDYSLYRRVGSVLTDGSSNIIQFTQIGDEFIWDITTQDANVAGTGTTAVSLTLSVPSGVKVIAQITALAASGISTNLLITSLDTVDTVPSTTAFTLATSAAAQLVAQTLRILTNINGQIRYRADVSVATFRLNTNGWTDFRGKDV